MPRIRITSAAAIIPIVALTTAAAVLVVLVVLSGRAPVVESVDPGVVTVGQELRLAGRHFGARLGRVTIAGRTVPVSAVRRWSDTEIRLSVPAGTVSGLLYVQTERGRSQGTMVHLQESLPRTSLTGAGPGVPVIERLSQAEIGIGGLLTIAGRNFGPSRRDSRVRFSMSDGLPCEICDRDIAYAAWSDTSIVVRVPAGVVSGFVAVITPWGTSNPLRYTVQRPAGEVVDGARVEIAVRHGVILDSPVIDVSVRSNTPASRDLVVRLPAVRPAQGQRAVRLISGGAGESRFEQVDAGFSGSLLSAVLLDRYELESRIDPARVPIAYETDSGFTRYYTRELPGIPVSDESIRQAVARLRAGRTNPYRIAEAAYAFVLDRLTFALGLEDNSALAALESGFGDGLSYATLFVALLRASGIPARVIGGVLVTTDRNAYPHFWAEYFITGVGWVPVDPALGDAAFPGSFPTPQDPRAYYFGNLDAYRVSFGPAFEDHADLSLGGAHWRPESPYTLQRLYVGAGAAVTGYRVDWIPPQVLAVAVRAGG